MESPSRRGQQVTQIDQMIRSTIERRVTLNLRMLSLINFAIEPPTPTMAGGRASLGGWQECLFGRRSLCLTPFLTLKPRGKVCGKKL